MNSRSGIRCYKPEFVSVPICDSRSDPELLGMEPNASFDVEMACLPLWRIRFATAEPMTLANIVIAVDASFFLR